MRRREDRRDEERRGGDSGVGRGWWVGEEGEPG